MASPSSTRAWILANHPKGVATFDSNDPGSTFKLVEQPIPALEPDQVLVKSLFLSNDPAQRPSIDAKVKAERHYSAPAKLGEPMPARGLAEVVDSKADSLPKGTIVQAAMGWTEYAVLKASECMPRPPLPGGLALTHYLGAFGGPGLTAYYGLVDVGQVKKGQRVVISGAAGATGSMAVQIAKNVSLLSVPWAGGVGTDSPSLAIRSSASPKSSALQVLTPSVAGSKLWAQTNVSITRAQVSRRI
jgi:NADPH-dependent curcumin reductase CurA